MRPSRRRQLAEAERREVQADQRAARAETEVRRLRAALDILPVGVVVADQHGAVVYRNRQGADLTGARGPDILVAQAVAELLAEARQAGPLSSTLELHGPPPRTLRVSARPIRDGTDLGAVAVSEDISSRRQLEATRRDFVANVSHELRTPVGALSVLTEALAGEEDPETTRRLAAHIAQESERLGRIIEDLLDLSRIEGEPAERETHVELDALLDAAVERVRPVAERHQVEIRTAPVRPSLAVVGDESQLVSAVANLLDNAVKYSEARSSVDLRGGETDGWIEVIVRDRGIGIPSKDLERIFERFYRVDRARSRQTGGTGLGLAIVRHVATNHGGDIRVESTEGMGSTFTLRLPAADS
ncbi:MAG: ATP-binding protein [Actinomycetota bacterium]|nr:ATP-binding protein [Actinomycetota bacterium]